MAYGRMEKLASHSSGVTPGRAPVCAAAQHINDGGINARRTRPANAYGGVAPLPLAGLFAAGGDEQREPAFGRML